MRLEAIALQEKGVRNPETRNQKPAMNTKLLMIISAVIMGIAGIVLSFLPQEIAEYIGSAAISSIMLQMMGALYFGFAMLNWTAKSNLIGGIYSKPVALANFAHFFIGGLALLKLAFNESDLLYIWIAGTIYWSFGILFSYVLFTNPALKK